MLDRINLVPQIPLHEKIRKSAPLVLVCVASALVLFFYVEKLHLEKKIMTIDKELTKLESEINKAQQMQAMSQKLVSDIKILNNEEKQLRLLVERISEPKRKKKLYTQVLGGIIRSLPASIKCNTILLHGTTGQISGASAEYKDLPGLITSLNAQPYFRNAILKDIGKNPQSNTERFTFNVFFELSDH
ncbi:MAG: hypothetical protein KKE17_15260 [Proteobacteria bacterium]|nr:hypothetical protein [Pseudomonadota bacterium]MBU1711358.1 hypothetical protein [Pseudomonadota bacterium]